MGDARDDFESSSRALVRDLPAPSTELERRLEEFGRYLDGLAARVAELESREPRDLYAMLERAERDRQTLDRRFRLVATLLESVPEDRRLELAELALLGG